jgi:hypothetical protein
MHLKPPDCAPLAARIPSWRDGEDLSFSSIRSAAATRIGLENHGRNGGGKTSSDEHREHPQIPFAGGRNPDHHDCA